MKINAKQLRISIAIILFSIVIGQGVWVFDMYRAYSYQLSQAVESAIEVAVLKEVTGRHEQVGGFIAYAPLAGNADTTRFISKTVQTKDTAFEVTLDRHDPHAQMRLLQFLLMDDLPVDLHKLDSLFGAELSLRGFPIIDTYVEYINLASGDVKQSGTSASNKDGFIASVPKPIDIFDTFAIRAYAHSSMMSILEQMTVQLILSFLLISICIFLLVAVIRTFFWRERLELMRQDSVNAMTHEFKRPISAAVVQASLIPYYLKKGQTEKVQGYAENVVLELKKLTAYTERIQQLSKGIGEDVTLHIERVRMADFFESITQSFLGRSEKPVDISLALETAQQYLEVDKIHFANIIDNLIENAIKYSGDSVSIAICISDAEQAGKLKIEVKDNGFGIPDSDIPHVFEKFYRSKTKSVQQQVGFGLGLTYVKALVHAHHGTINVTSALGVGAEFTLYFPTNDA